MKELCERRIKLRLISESEWVPVEKTQESIMAPRNSSSYSKAIVDPAVSVSYPTPQTVSYPMPVVPYRPPLPPANSILPAPKVSFVLFSNVFLR